MKKLLLVILSFFAINSFAQNISTGLNTAGGPESIGGNDVTWRYGTVINGTSVPLIIPSFTSHWPATPLAGTGAQFIGNNASNTSQKPGDYFFERKITIPSGTKTLFYSFSVAVDDELKAIEIINPSGSVEKDLLPDYKPSPGKAVYFPSLPMKGNIEVCDKPGVWKIRIKVNFFDTIAGLLVNGNVELTGQCPSDQTFEDTKCCVSEKAINLSTGYRNTSNSLIPNNSPDDEWKLSSSPSGSATAKVVNPIGNPFAPTSSKATWLFANSSDPGKYTYERTIVVPPGYEAILTFSRIGADNEVDLFTEAPSAAKVLQYHSNFPTPVGGTAFWAKNATLKQCLRIKGLAAGTHKIIAEVKNDNLGTGLLVEGCYELFQVACKCPEGWLSNTSNKDGDITLDGKCKKMICGPINIKPFPKNGTQVDGNIGFFWDGNIYFYGTKANGGAAICPPKLAEPVNSEIRTNLSIPKE